MIFEDMKGKARTYLHDCYCKVIRPDGSSVITFVQSHDKGLKLHTSQSLENNELPETVKGEEISGYEFHSPKLGYFNRRSSPIFISRIPSRNWRVGVNSRNSNIPGTMRTLEILLGLEAIENGIFPSFQDVSGNKISKAFTARYCLKGKDLYYCGNKVAIYKKGVLGFFTEKELSYHVIQIESLTMCVFDLIEPDKEIDPEKEDY